MTSPRAPRAAPERHAYLPPRAARARKLILRGQLGLGWIVGSVVFALVILVAGVLLLVQGGRPGAPWVQVASLEDLPPGSVRQVTLPGGRAVLLDRREGRVRAFAVPPGECAVTATPGGFARPCTGQRWGLDGAPQAGAAQPLPRLRVLAARGGLYVDPSTPAAATPPTPPRARPSGSPAPLRAAPAGSGGVAG